ncbi:MAG: ferritin family protein [Dehalococcoidales bacterium]|nr:ferritin family protein [Dehalococcoidales bacterium]
MKQQMVPDELAELLNTAIYKEIASNAFYIAGQSRTRDPGAKVLMKEMADEELKHSEWLKRLKEKGLEKRSWYQKEVPNLRISEYLTGSDTLENASLQDTIIFAMKREQLAVEFYARMMGVIRDKSAKRLCTRLAREELKHKLRLEIFYDDLFYQEV